MAVANRVFQFCLFLVFVTLPAVHLTSAQTSTNEGHSAASSLYAGYEACKTCHGDLVQQFEKTAHYSTVLDKKANAAHQGCEGCHGPGQAHIEGGGDVPKSFVSLS